MTIKERHDAQYIAFADDCVAPATLDALAAKLKEEGPVIYWQCETRLERKLTSRMLRDLKEAGCLNLIFGLESYSPRVLSLMNKGIDHDQIERILDDCRRSGIAFNLRFFFGFPGERLGDAAVTVEFVKRQAHGAATFSFGTFELQKGAPVERYPDRFNLTHVNRSTGPLSVRLEFAPMSSHAENIRLDLRQELLELSVYPYARFSINAHTLIFLGERGTCAMGNLYRNKTISELRDPLTETNLMESRIAPNTRQSVGIFRHAAEELGQTSQVRSTENPEHTLLYDYVQEKTVEVTGLVMRLLADLDARLPHLS